MDHFWSIPPKELRHQRTCNRRAAKEKDEEHAPTSTCNLGVRLTVLPNTMEKRTKEERGIHDVTLLDDER